MTMVFFSCNGCGDSLKKNKVAAHRKSGRCNASPVSCIDCGVEFKGEDYSGHVKCVSEAEKYAPKGPVKSDQSKPEGPVTKQNVTNGNDVKRSNWSNAWRVAIESSSLKPSAKQILTKMLSNLPTKLQKLKNYIENSAPLRDNVESSDVEALLDKVHEEHKKINPSATYGKSQKSTVKPPKANKAENTQKKARQNKRKASNDEKNNDNEAGVSPTKKHKQKRNHEEKQKENQPEEPKENNGDVKVKSPRNRRRNKKERSKAAA